MPYIKRNGIKPRCGFEMEFDALMMRIFKFLFLLVVLAAAGLVGFAYFGDLSPEQTRVTEPVSLNAN